MIGEERLDIIMNINIANTNKNSADICLFKTTFLCSVKLLPMKLGLCMQWWLQNIKVIVIPSLWLLLLVMQYLSHYNRILSFLLSVWKHFSPGLFINSDSIIIDPIIMFIINVISFYNWALCTRQTQHIYM